MTTYDWHTVYTDAVQRFGGDTPGSQLEQQILDAFTDQPQLVVRAIDKVAAKYTAGKVQSPWGAMHHEIRRATNQPHLQAVDSTDRDKSIIRAEQWIRAAGIHYDRDTEILHELFGELGILRPYAQINYAQDGSTPEGHPVWTLTEPKGDTALVERMLNAYHDARPAGITLETEALERAETWKQQQARIAAIKTQVLAEFDAKQAADTDDDLPL